MKWLPCKSCRTGAVSRPTNRFPKGQPQISGSFSGSRLVYSCGRCKRSQVLLPQEYRALPELSVEDLRSMNLDDLAEAQARAEEKAKGQET